MEKAEAEAEVEVAAEAEAEAEVEAEVEAAVEVEAEAEAEAVVEVEVGAAVEVGTRRPTLLLISVLISVVSAWRRGVITDPLKYREMLRAQPDLEGGWTRAASHS